MTFIKPFINKLNMCSYEVTTSQCNQTQPVYIKHTLCAMIISNADSTAL